jgi:imidazole glycerol phosphate synthase subunit HisF
MLSKRVIVCLDVRDRKVTKGVRFQGNVDVGDPVELGERYYREGADELVFYDITASAETPAGSSFPSPWEAASGGSTTCVPCSSRGRRRSA